MTDFLFAKPNFISSIGAVIDFGGTMARFNESVSSEEADYIALMNDWAMVGNDMRNTINQFALVYDKNEV